MADLTELQAAQPVKVVGSSTSGSETNPLDVDVNGSAKTTLCDPSSGNGVTTTVVSSKQALDTTLLTAIPAGSNIIGAVTQSGTWTVQQGTPPWSVTMGASSDRLGNDTIDSLNDYVAVNTQGSSTISFNVSGTWSATLLLEATLDGTTWFTITGADRQTGFALQSTTTNRVIYADCAAFSQVRLRASAYTSGTATVVYDAAVGVFNPIEETIANVNTTAPQQAQFMGGYEAATGFIRPLAVDNQGRLVTSAITGFGSDFSFGDVTLSAIAKAPVRRTTYTEQTTNAQRSIASANANDTAAGTGARTVRIVYLDASGNGPYTEDVTLNGTSYVNTVATNICFIEEMTVLTAGSGGVNAGILTLKAATAGGGATIWTIAAGDNQTFGAHHYVPTGKIANITGISCGHNGTTVGSGGLFIVTAKPLSTASVEAQVSDFVRLYGQSSTFARSYVSPIKVTGPARLLAYVTPETSSSTIYRCSIDFFEP